MDGIQQALEKVKAQRAENSETEETQGEVVDVLKDTPEEEAEEENSEALGTVELSKEADDNQEGESEEDLDTLVYEINGKEYTQKQIMDALDSNLRLSDYTQKTQKVAEDRKALEADKEQFDGKMSELQANIDLLSEMSDTEFEGIDWEDLRNSDTGEYLRLKEKQESKKGKISKAQADRQKLVDDKRKELGQSEAAKLFDVLGWRDDASKQNADTKLIQSYIADAGWTDQEFGEIINHKHMVVVLEAAKYQALKSKSVITEKKVKKSPVVVKGRKASVTSIDRQISDAEAKLKKTGKIDDARALQKLKRQLK